jgi:hypothetical protein
MYVPVFRALRSRASASIAVSAYSSPVNQIQEWPTWDLWQYRGGTVDWNLFRGDRSDWERRFLGSPDPI